MEKNLMTREQACEHVEVSLKEYFESRFLSLKEATEHARINLEKRLDILNNERTQTLEDRRLFVTRELHDRLQMEVNEVKTLVGKYAVIAGIIVSAIQVASPVLLYFFLRNH